MGFQTASAPEASADTQIGWVLAATGSVQCNVASGTNNHVLCYSYPNGGGSPTLRFDAWMPYACLGGAFMTGGGGNVSPAELRFQNVPGYYCGWAAGCSGYCSFAHVGTCWNSSDWLEGSVWADINQVRTPYNIFPDVPNTAWNFPYAGCSPNVGESQALVQFWRF